LSFVFVNEFSGDKDMNSTAIIDLENVSKYYHDVCAVNRINMQIKKGEVLGLLGPNGAGKTTTLRMLTGYFPPSSGTIKFKDLDIREDVLPIKEMIGYLPESAPLYHYMLVYDYLDYVAKVRGLAKSEKDSRIKHLAELCGLNSIMHKSIGELSKGLNQRVGLAHAMMSDPEILILDEPTSGLDPNQIIEIREIIRRIGQEKTVIVSTHILSEAEATCDRIVIINEGKIVADDQTQTLKKMVRQEQQVDISLQGVGFDEAKHSLGAIQGVSQVQKLEAEGPETTSLRLYLQSNEDKRGAIYQKIKNTDWILLDFHQQAQTLEDIFRELTKEN
jgi:ABC-2 type transport system ATP-binding protein